MKTNQIVVDAAKTLGKDMRLTGMREVYKYVNRERTNELEGYRYEVVLLDRAFEKVSFKIADLNPLFSEEEVENNIAVKPINPQISLYANYQGGETGMNVTADSLMAADE